MDFLLSQCVPGGLETHRPLKDIEDQNQAVTEALKIAHQTREGSTVGLFTHDGEAICGWKVLKGDKLRTLDTATIGRECFVDAQSFDFADRQVQKRRKAKQ